MKKKLLVVLVIALLTVLGVVACEKRTTEPTTTEPQTTEHTTFAPYTDENGKLNVDVSDYVFE